jgi:multimeric flavodoxin WrbA
MNITKAIQASLSQFPGAKLTSIREMGGKQGRIDLLVDGGTTDLLKLSQIFQHLAGVLVKAGYSEMMTLESDWTELNLSALKPANLTNNTKPA